MNDVAGERYQPDAPAAGVPVVRRDQAVSLA